MNQIIQEIYETRRVVSKSGKIHELNSEIDREEGEFLFNIIRNDSSVLTTLEVGCAYGLSSLFICAGIQDRAGASHTIIDPHQSTYWDGVGIANLEKSGIGFFKLIEAQSEVALPQLLEHMEGKIDFVLVDGWHTFDHTLLDCFYATRLLRVGGYLAIDDVAFPSVRRAVDFLSNYPCYELYGSVGEEVSKSWKKIIARSVMFPISRKTWQRLLSRSVYGRIFQDRLIRMVAFKKISEDQRKWEWHDDAF
jgi:predicted O-methyltransferase YrrM